MVPILWEDVDLKSALLLIPEVELSEANANELKPEEFDCVFSFPKTLDLTRFKLYADFVKVVRARVPYILQFHGQGLNAALQRPPLPNLQRLVLNTHGSADATTFRWVSDLLTPCLKRLEFQSIYLEASGGEDTCQQHSWIEHEECFELISQISRECPHLETLRIFPSAHSGLGTAFNSTNYYGITSLKHLRNLALGAIDIDKQLFLALGQLPCLETLSLHGDRPDSRQTKDDRMDIPDDSFLALRHLALYGLSVPIVQHICTLPPLFRHLVRASFIFCEFGFRRISDQRDFSFTLLQCLDRSPHLVDLTVLTPGQDTYLALYPPVTLDIFSRLPLRRLRLDRARLKSWGNIDELVDSDDSDEDEGVGHVEIQWRDFFVTVPHLEELHLDLHFLMPRQLPVFASSLPNLRLLVLMGVLFESGEVTANRAAMQPITIRCPFYIDIEYQNSWADASRLARLWPNAQFQVEKSMAWMYDDSEALDEATEVIAKYNDAIELLRSSDS